jgi:hypothetical protein
MGHPRDQPSRYADFPGSEALALQILASGRKRILDPVDRYSEIIFGLIMVLTFTGTLRVAEAGRQQVYELLIAALGCNLAWGIVDGVMYVVTSVVERARKVALLLGIRAAPLAEAPALVRAALPGALAPVTEEQAVEHMAARIRGLPALPLRSGVEREDLKGALACFLLTVAATFPPTLPFLVIRDTRLALHVSNAVAVLSLFLAGVGLGRATGVRGWRVGLAMVVLGSALVGLAIALGG